MGRHLYVYYRTMADANAAPLREFLARVAAATGVEGRLQRRPGVTDGMFTWMECYADVPDAFELTLDELWQAFPGAALAGPRHPELFEDA